MRAPLSVIGLGAVSPLGDSAVAHAARLRARLHPAVASAFTFGDRPVAAMHVPWIDARLPVRDRMATLAKAAVTAARHDVDAESSVFLVLPPARPGFDGDDAAAVTLELGRAAATFDGDAGAFAAVAAAQQWIAAGRAPAVTIVAVDSFVSLQALTRVVERPPSPWAKLPLAHAEGAFAITVATAGARRAIGAVEAAATAHGTGTDDDDDPVDGEALTELLRALPPRGAIRALWGQGDVDDLRERELRLALARTASLWAPDVESDSVERFTGRLGAAAGLGNLVAGLALAAFEGAAARAPFAAWAISPDGTRGVALVRGGSS